jgi:hypothetical protein
VFQPSRDEVRRFFVEAWRKRAGGAPATPLETIAGDWIEQHPEHHAELADLATALAASSAADDGPNAFLHLSMHLSITEQVSIDQPPGIRAAVERLAARLGSVHAAQHEAMECLGTMLWESQRSGRPPDGAAYVECVARRAS